jgi:ribosome-associated protein
MISESIHNRGIEKELVLTAVRSSGPGGQHVNKVSTCIELRFNVPASQVLREEEKHRIMIKLANRINKEGILILHSQSERSQHDNKTKVVERLFKLLERALTPVKKRRATHPTVTSITRRLEDKRFQSEKKQFRKKLDTA